MTEINKKKLFLLEEIVKKNFTAKYKDSILGIIWSVLKPLLVMILLTIIFSTIFGSKIENYPVYFLSGKCIVDFFNSATSLSIDSLKGNKNILQRNAVPKHIFVLGSVFSEFMNFIITLVILVGVMIVTKAPFHFITMPLGIIPIISLLIMSIGFSLILSIVCVYYTDIQHLWGVLTVMISYASGIFYPMDIIPEPYHQYMILSPLYWIIDQFRNLFIWGNIPNGVYVLNSLIISTIVLVFGIIVFKKYEQKITLRF